MLPANYFLRQVVNLLLSDSPLRCALERILQHVWARFVRMPVLILGLFAYDCTPLRMIAVAYLAFVLNSDADFGYVTAWCTYPPILPSAAIYGCITHIFCLPRCALRLFCIPAACLQ